MTRAKQDPDIQAALQALGNRIRDLRKAQGYESFERFAYEKEFNRVQMGRYENGANISFANLVKLVKAFGIPLSEFFEEGFEEVDEES